MQEDTRIVGGGYMPVTDFLFANWHLCLVPVVLGVVMLPFELLLTLPLLLRDCLRTPDEYPCTPPAEDRLESTPRLESQVSAANPYLRARSTLIPPSL